MSQPKNLPAIPQTIGEMFNAAASLAAFAEYRNGLAKNSLQRHDRALLEFGDFLVTTRDYADRPQLATDPSAWARVAWGQVAAFKNDMLTNGFAIATINSTLSIVRKYASLAYVAGFLPETEYLRIGKVHGIKPNEAENIDAKRKTTRLGAKKAEANAITGSQRRQLLKQQDLSKPSGRRDAVLMRLLFVYTLRISEALALTVDKVDATTGLVEARRIKTKKNQKLRLRGAALAALQDYIEQDSPTPYLFPPSRKNGKIGKGDKPMTRQAAFDLVRKYGQLIGIANLSPHDGRHTATTLLADQGVEFDKVRDIRGDAKGSTIALQYIKQREVANDSVSEEVFGDGK